jgi:hypothetical protein
MTKPNPTEEDFDALRFDLVGFIRTQIVGAAAWRSAFAPSRREPDAPRSRSVAGDLT